MLLSFAPPLTDLRARTWCTGSTEACSEDDLLRGGPLLRACGSQAQQGRSGVSLRRCHSALRPAVPDGLCREALAGKCASVHAMGTAPAPSIGYMLKTVVKINPEFTTKVYLIMKPLFWQVKLDVE